MPKPKILLFLRNFREINKNIETLLFGNDEININETSIIFNKVRAKKMLISGLSSGLHQHPYPLITLVSLYIVLNIIYTYACDIFVDLIMTFLT